MSTSWKVILTKGENEPWWFFEGWEKDIVSEYSFEEKHEALIFFHEKLKSLQNEYPHIRQKNDSMAAFWHEEEKEFCEACDDDLQTYHGLLLMQNQKPYVPTYEEKAFFRV
ncbi:DUF1033 family protein [Falsibacillus pallidus]|uniref:DUF1033 family protein n=1 Tax=Falsibacillus pallidus TaxID=493781 RepID=UPI003D95CC7B